MKRRKIIKNIEAKALPYTVVLMLIGVALTGMFLVGPLSPPTVKAVTGDFTYHKLITIDKTKCSGTNTNLVIWVHNTSSDFSDNCQVDGDDIAFFSADGNTQYKHDLEVWNSTTGEIGAWVNISDEINTTDDFTFYIYYGDPDGTDQRDMDGTWDAKYSAVYHMNATLTATTLYDSSGNGHTVTESSAPTYQHTGKFGACTYQDGNDDFWACSNHEDFNFNSGDFTIIAWVNITNAGAGNQQALAGKGGAQFWYLVYAWSDTIPDSAMFIDDNVGPVNTNTGVNISDDGWHQLVFVRENDAGGANHDFFKSYDNAVFKDCDDIGDYGNISDAEDFVLGSSNGKDATFSIEGNMDEVWIIKGTALDNESINTTYASQNDSGFLTFGAQDEPPSFWGNWSDTWTISSGHTCSGTGYEYGNWSFSEHINASTLDELWTEANETYWYTADNSSWWGGEYTYCANTSGVNSSFTVLNNSGLNRTQGFGWVHINDTDDGYLYPYIIFAYNGSTDFDCVMWDPFDGGHVWLLNWNGTNMSDIPTNNPVVTPSVDATDIDTGVWEFADYLTLEGNYYKYIYNELAGTLNFKYWSGGAFNEPAYWATQYQHANITHTEPRCQGIGFWNPYSRVAIMEWDLMNIWQLNYTTNASAWCNISGCNESRPHMDFPVLNISAWTDEMMSYFNESFDGNISADLVRSMMKDNVTNLMNLESRMFEMKTVEASDQNDTIYYYSCLVDEWQTYNPEAEYDEWLHLHIQMCPEDEIDLAEFGDVMVAIDVDNNHLWDANDRLFWAYADGLYDVTRLEYNGNGDPINPPTFGSSIWQSEPNANGNLHRYNSHLNYVLNIPLATLVKTGGDPLNVSDVFGLSILSSMSGTNPTTQLPAIWQNWNESSEAPFWDEDSDFNSAQAYFFNGSGEGPELPNSTTINRWGEGIITDAGGGYNESGDISYNMTIEASFNDTSATSDDDYVHVNTSIYVNNTGAGSLTGIYINMSWWNCTCSDLNMTLINSSLDISNWTWFNDSCYAVIHNPAIEPLTTTSSWHIWFNINITNCSGVTSATEYLNITGNATELDEDVTVDGDDAPTFHWGLYATKLCTGFETNITDVGAVATSVFAVLGVLLIIGSILMIVVVVKKYGWM